MIGREREGDRERGETRTCPWMHMSEASSRPYGPNLRADIGFSKAKEYTKEPSLNMRISPK